MSYPRYTPATEDIGQDEAETFQKIPDAFVAMGQIMRARMFVYRRTAALRERRDGETPSKPKAADAPA